MNSIYFQILYGFFRLILLKLLMVYGWWHFKFLVKCNCFISIKYLKKLLMQFLYVLRLFVSFLLLLVFFQVQAQSDNIALGAWQTQISKDKKYLSEKWSLQNGLPVNNINQMYQTPDGFIWSATFNGLLRFDGVNFKLYDVSNTPELPSNRITTITAGQGNSFWLTTEQHHLIHYEGGNFTVFEGILNAQELQVVVDGDSLTWVLAQNRVNQFDGQTKELEPISPVFSKENEANSLIRLKNGFILIGFGEEGKVLKTKYPYVNFDTVQTFHKGKASILFEDSKGRLWGAHNRINFAERDRIVDFANEPEIYSGWSEVSAFYHGIKEDNNNHVWVTSETGLYKATDGKLEYIYKKPFSFAPDISVWRGATMTQCRDGSIWNIQDNKVFRNGELQFETESLASCILCDLEDNIWVSVLRKGFQRYRLSMIENIVVDEYENNFYGVYEDSSERLWFGSWVHGMHYKTVDGQLVSFPFGRIRGALASFLEGSDGTIYAGRLKSSLKDGNSLGLRESFEEIKGLNESVFAIKESKDGTIWFGDKFGLHRLRKGKSEVESVKFANDKVSFPVRFILETSGNTLWMATNGGGIRKYNYETGVFALYDISHGLSSDNVRGLMEDKKGNIWIATEDKGLNRLNPNTGEINVLRSANGLFHDGLHNLILDDFGRLWMSTNHGIFWVNFKELENYFDKKIDRVKSIAYTERDGMLNREANGGFQNSALKSSNGDLYFASQMGIVKIDPNKIGLDIPLSKVVIDQVYSKNKKVAFEDGQIKLEPNETDFSIDFTSPGFTAPERVRYKYKLEGFDKYWVESGVRREAIYTNVPAGEYKFSVVAFYEGGLGNAVITEIAVIKLPKYYETQWFKLGVLFLFTFLVIGFYKVRVRQLKKKQRELEKLVELRTHDLEEEKKLTEAQKEKLIEFDKEKNKVFANISHEFRTPLTLILGPLQELREGRDGCILTQEAKSSLDMGVRNTKRLIRLVEQLMDLAKLEAKQMSLDLQPSPLNDYLMDIALSFQGIAESKSINYSIHMPEESVILNFDPNQFDKIIANLLSNAFKFTPSGGTIDLSLKVEDQEAIIAVSDSGIGISKDNLPRLFDRFYQIEKSELQPGSGIGLSLTKELTILHGGMITAQSELKKGTTLTLKFPCEACLDMKDVGTLQSFNIFQESDFESKELPQEQEENENYSSDKAVILIVDDNKDIRKYVMNHLNKKYKVIEATSGREALLKLEESLPDLIISDVMMPDGDGFFFLKAIRSNPNWAFLPFIFLTAKNQIEDKLEALEIGGDGFLPKPFKMEELLAIVKHQFQLRKRLQAHYSYSESSTTDYVTFNHENSKLESSEAQYLKVLFEIVREHLSDEKFTVESLADKMNQSRSNLYRKVFSLTNETPSNLLKRMRLERSVLLVESRAGSISEIAYSCGFNSIAHFSKIFKDKYGKSPSDYANSFIQEK